MLLIYAALRTLKSIAAAIPWRSLFLIWKPRSFDLVFRASSFTDPCRPHELLSSHLRLHTTRFRYAFCAAFSVSFYLRKNSWDAALAKIWNNSLRLLISFVDRTPKKTIYTILFHFKWQLTRVYHDNRFLKIDPKLEFYYCFQCKVV